MNNKRYWLRGGIAGLVFNAIFTLPGIIIGIFAHDVSDAFGTVAEKIFNFFGTILLYIPLGKEGFQFPLLFVISFGFTSIVGAVIGWIYGKIKNRNNTN